MTLPNGAAPTGLSRTERKFWEVLSDGKAHAGEDLVKCLWDDLGLNLKETVQVHISNIRRKLPAGYHITTTKIDGKLNYILVRELSLPGVS